MSKKAPMRMCVGCREMKDKQDLIRVIRMADGQFCIDNKKKMNGRGAYICRNIECLETARKNRSLERSLKTRVPDEIYDELEKEIETKVAE